MTCSRLSSTSRVGVSATCSATTSTGGARALEGRAHRRHNARGAPASSRAIGASGTKTVPCGSRIDPAGAPTATASRVLPMPPGPVRVTNRTSGRLQQLGDSPRYRAHARSATSRPPATSAGSAGHRSTWRMSDEPRRCLPVANRLAGKNAGEIVTDQPPELARATERSGVQTVPLAWSSAIMAVSRASRSGAGVLSCSRRGVDCRRAGTRPRDPRCPCPGRSNHTAASTNR